MVLLGVSILLASITFLCYRNSPLAWSLLAWLRQPSTVLQDLTKTERIDDAPPTSAPPTFEISTSPEDKEAKYIISEDAPPKSVTKADEDRRAMPPPPPLFKPKSKPSSPTTPRASATNPSPIIPAFILGSDNEEPSAPSFPALNSAQRASGRARGPPRLNHVSPYGSAPGTSNITNAGLMAPPPRPSPLPNRGSPSTTSSGLAPPPTHIAPPTKPRKKVLLTSGHSPLDWARLTSSPSFLASQPSSLLKIPPSVLKHHNGRKDKPTREKKDIWMALGGKVYNITPYMPYHPGGEPELMKGAGRDATRLFGEVHPWVNWEGMLEGCLVGVLVEEGEGNGGGWMEEMD